MGTRAPRPARAQHPASRILPASCIPHPASCPPVPGLAADSQTLPGARRPLRQRRRAVVCAGPPRPSAPETAERVARPAAPRCAPHAAHTARSAPRALHPALGGCSKSPQGGQRRLRRRATRPNQAASALPTARASLPPPASLPAPHYCTRLSLSKNTQLLV